MINPQGENSNLEQQSSMSSSSSSESEATRPTLSSHSQLIHTPPPIKQILPPPSIYDTSRDPEDQSDIADHPHFKFFPASREVKNSLRGGWRILGASRRGYGHAYEGKYREDDFNIRIFSSSNLTTGQNPELAIIAIADGFSSKSLSRRGARAATLGATGISEQRLEKLILLLSKNAQYQECQEEAYTILMDALQTARNRVEECAQHSKVTVDELLSTLLVFLAASVGEEHLLVASSQIGDGALFGLQPHKGGAPSKKWSALQRPQIQSTGNEVQAFMRTGTDEWSSFYQCELLEKATCIMGMTDGTADDIEPPRATPENPNPDPFSMVDDFYQRIIEPSFKGAQSGEALIKLLGYKKKQSYDDRTVVCLYRQ